MRLELALNDLTWMDGESNDGRTPTALGCRYLHLIDEVAVSQMHPIEEADGGHRRGEGLRMFFYNFHSFVSFRRPKGEESREHKVDVIEILRFALDDIIVIHFYSNILLKSSPM